jgi:oligopeptide transport system ATP-binding protein
VSQLEPLLEVKDVRTWFPIYKGMLLPRKTADVKAVDGVSLWLAPGETLGLVGESGCGKSTLGRTIMALAQATSGTIRLGGRELTSLSGAELKRIRPEFQMIFQDPYASLNPRMTVFDTLAEPLLTHGVATRSNVAGKVRELMETVGLAPRFMRKYPHEFSGGQRQRIAIARAISLGPRLLIADEPVSALDVSIQSQILNLLVSLKRKLGLAMVFISHDLSVVRHISDRVAVMYLGRIVETGPTDEVFARPRHPYTRALLSAIPLADPDRERARQRIILEGDPPSPLNPPSGCAFNPRCPYATDACRTTPQQLEARGRAEVACMRVDELPEFEGALAD